MTTRDVIVERRALNAVGSKYQEFLHPRLKGKWRSKGLVKPDPQQTISPAAQPTPGAPTTAPSGKEASASTTTQPDVKAPAGSSSLIKTKMAGERRLMLDGSDLPEHIAKLKIPPAWRKVRIASDPNAELLAKGVDEKGRVQSIYSDAHWARVAAVKFARVQELIAKRDQIISENNVNRTSDKQNVRENADVMALILATGIRPGSERDTGAEKQAYGATTLQGRHVVQADDEVRLRFIGKKGVSLDIPVFDKEVADMLLARKKAVGDSGNLFATSAGNLLKYSHTLDGGNFKTKDFRTLTGTMTAIQEIGRAKERPQTMNDYKRMVKEVAKAVATKLGNTPTVALQSYIDPSVFSAWRVIA